MKRCSENMQQIYRRTPMPKCDFNKVAKQFSEHIFKRTLMEGCFWLHVEIYKSMSKLNSLKYLSNGSFFGKITVFQKLHLVFYHILPRFFKWFVILFKVSRTIFGNTLVDCCPAKKSMIKVSHKNTRKRG